MWAQPQSADSHRTLSAVYSRCINIEWVARPDCTKFDTALPRAWSRSQEGSPDMWITSRQTDGPYFIFRCCRFTCNVKRSVHVFLTDALSSLTHADFSGLMLPLLNLMLAHMTGIRLHQCLAAESDRRSFWGRAIGWSAVCKHAGVIRNGPLDDIVFSSHVGHDQAVPPPPPPSLTRPGPSV